MRSKVDLSMRVTSRPGVVVFYGHQSYLTILASFDFCFWSYGFIAFDIVLSTYILITGHNLACNLGLFSFSDTVKALHVFLVGCQFAEPPLAQLWCNTSVTLFGKSKRAQLVLTFTDIL